MWPESPDGTPQVVSEEALLFFSKDQFHHLLSLLQESPEWLNMKIHRVGLDQELQAPLLHPFLSLSNPLGPLSHQ